MARHDAAGLLRDGILVPATVVGVRDTGWRQGDSDDLGNPAIWTWSLDVDAPDGRYRVSCEQDVPWALARVAGPGRQVLVRVHPRDRATVVVDAVETARWYGVTDPVPLPTERVGVARKPVAPGRASPRPALRMFFVTGTLLVVGAAVLAVVGLEQDGTARTVVLGFAGLCAVLALVFLLVGRSARRMVRPPRRAVVARALLVDVKKGSSEYQTATVYRVRADVHLVDRVERMECPVLVPSVWESAFGTGRWLVVRLRPRRPRRFVPDWDATGVADDAARRHHR
jgi:hypothetical protein